MLKTSCRNFLLESDIKSFMGYYRDTFPQATVTPKLHMLEDHVVPLLERWHGAFGLMGEQGAESIHAYFNSLNRQYQTTKDPVVKLNTMMREHLTHIVPENITARPPPAKRRQSNTTS